MDLIFKADLCISLSLTSHFLRGNSHLNVITEYFRVRGLASCIHEQVLLSWENLPYLTSLQICPLFLGTLILAGKIPLHLPPIRHWSLRTARMYIGLVVKYVASFMVEGEDSVALLFLCRSTKHQILGKWHLEELKFSPFLMILSCIFEIIT